ncbi:hypothetical protein BGW42_006321 [Actinomortierella wolfii]|nr:hypothetical protein BGW42_006321 [Actinomortierella wolfii]
MVSTASHLSATATGTESPQPDGGTTAAPKPPPRVWGVVAATTEKNLAEFPTAAEASKMVGHETQADGTSHHPSQGTNGVSKSSEANKSLSNISVENKWDEIDDENEDFLFAEKIEFADGAVNVKEVVNLVAQSEETKPQQQRDSTAQIAPQHEERVVDRSEDDFDRQWPHRQSTGTHGADSASRYGSSTGDRPRQQLWQGGLPSSTRDPERRPSMDRDRRPSADYHGSSFGPPSSGRRESFGQRDSFRGNGPSRRDSATGRLDTLGAAPRDFGDRRDSFDHYRDRDYDYGRGRNYSRERDYVHGRSDYQDRRGSYDRRSRDRSSQRHDLHPLSRSRDSLAERGGDRPHEIAHHDAPGSDRSHYEHGSSYGRQHPYAHVPAPPPGVVEFDRPSHVSEEQRETMKHAAEEARKRREEEERQREEAKARAKAKADEIARAMERKQKEKEEADRAKQEEEKAKQLAAEKENQTVQEAEKTSVKTPETSSSPVMDKDKGRNDKARVLSTTDKPEEANATAEQSALPAKLEQESKEETERTRADRRREDVEKRGVSTPSSAWASSQSNQDVSWRRTEAGDSDVTASTLRGASAIANGSTSKPLRSEAKEPTVGEIDSIMKNIKEHFDSRGTTFEEMEASIKRTAQSQDASASMNTTENGTEVASSSSVALDTKAGASETESQTDKVMGTRERLKLRGPRGGERGPGTTASSSPSTQSRADNAQTWRRETPLPEAKPAPVPTAEETKATPASGGAPVPVEESTLGGVDNAKPPEVEAVEAPSGKAADDSLATGAKGRESNDVHVEKGTTKSSGSVRPIKRQEPKDYPARTVDQSQHPTVDDITALFAQISNVPAGESPAFDPTAMKAAILNTTDIPNKAATKGQVPSETAATTTTVERVGKDHSHRTAPLPKRHSLSNMSASIVLPSNVELAVNRGRMSFMVASEIDGEGTPDKGAEEDDKENIATNNTIVQESDSQQGNTLEDNSTKPVASAPSMLSSSVAVHPGMYGIQQAGSVGSTALPQYAWSGVEASQAGNLPGTTGLVMPPTGSTAHTMQPYQHVMQPFYTYVHPYFFQYGPRGPVHPSLAQYSATAMMPGSQQSRMMMDGTNVAVLATGSGQHDGFSSVTGVSGGGLSASSTVVAGNLGSSSTKTSTTGTAATSTASQTNDTHPWLPRFSAAGDAPATAAAVAVPAATTQFMMPSSNIIGTGSQRGGLSSRPLSTHVPPTFHQVTAQDARSSSASSPATPTGSGFQSMSEDDGWTTTATSNLGVHSSATAAQHGWGLPSTGTTGRMHVHGGGSGGAGAAAAGGSASAGVAMTPGFIVPGQDAFHPQVQAPIHGRNRGGYGGHYGRGGYASHHQHVQHQHHDGHAVQQHAMSGNLIPPMVGVGVGGPAGDRTQRSFGNPTATSHHHHSSTHFHGHHGPPGASYHSRRVHGSAATGTGGVAIGSGGGQAGGNSAGGAPTSSAGASSSTTTYTQFTARSSAGTTSAASGNATGSF